MRQQVQRIIFQVVQAAIGLVLAGWLVRATLRQSGADVLAELRAAAPSFLLAAVLIYGVMLGLTTVRWWLLLRVQGIHLTAWTVTRLTMIGVFFSLALPSSVGGDLVKMGYVSRQAPGRAAEGIMAIIVDRIIGLFGLLVAAVMAIPLSWSFLRQVASPFGGGTVLATVWGFALSREQVVFWLTAFIGACCVAGILGLLAVEFHEQWQRWLPGLNPALGWGRRHLPAGLVAVVDRLVAALDLYRDQKRVVALAILLSVGVHLLAGTVLFGLGRAIHEPAATPRQYLLTALEGNCVAGIPLTQSGFGTRDVVVKLLLTTAGAAEPKAGAAAFFYTLVVLFWGLVGGGIFILARGQSRQPALGEPR